jgi:hypothetical protein
MPDPIPAYIQEVEEKLTSLGLVLYIKVRRYDEKPMTWSEIWQVYSSSYPNKWAVQFFPPISELVDEANIYHLYVLHETPFNCSIKR